LRTEDFPLRYLARITIEFTTPFFIAGKDDVSSDSMFVADANGLPTIPGSSIAGVLRHAFSDSIDEDQDKRIVSSIFGYQENDEGCGSRLSVSFGCIHDSTNKPVEGILPATGLADPVLRQSLDVLRRDHVRINHLGSADEHGKFEDFRVPAGHRFTFEMLLEGNESDQPHLNRLLSILASDSTRFGGKSRRGYGAFEVVSLKQDVFNLYTDQGYNGFTSHPVHLSIDSPMQEMVSTLEPLKSDNCVTAELKLVPKGLWFIGGGDDEDADLSPIMESRIIWDETGGRVGEPEVVVPGAAIKGVISHRVAYHHNRISGNFADNKSGEELLLLSGTNNKAVREIFGFHRSNTDGQRGRLLIDDCYIGTPDQKIVDHVSIDRFTGGARTMGGALFNEKPICDKTGFSLNITISESDSICESSRKALSLALRDMAIGLVAVGSGSGRGNGFFESENGINWSDGGKWIGAR